MLLKYKIEIERWLCEHRIFKCELIESNNQLSSLIKITYQVLKTFKKVEGFFNCSNNKLKSLKEGPKIVNGNYYCNDNKLTSLEGCPSIINGEFNCSNNELNSLKKGPEIVKCSFYCNDNKLKMLRGLPDVKGKIDLSNNLLENIEDLPKLINSFLDLSNNNLIIE